MKDLTMLIGHADDEAIFLWAFLERTKKIICASSDRFNKDRQWCRERGECLREVGKLIGAEIVIHENDSEFYRLPTRNGSLKVVAEDLLRALEGSETVASHNAWGEYANIDHQICHHIARTHQARHGGQLLVTDIATEINWLPVTAWEIDLPQRNMTLKTRIDRPLFDRIKAIYDARGCWTWSFPVQEECRVYSL